MIRNGGWIGVDLDGTLAYHGGDAKWVPWNVIGEPIPLMVERVKNWIAEGREVRIFTARVHNDSGDPEKDRTTGQMFTVEEMTFVIHSWLIKQGLPPLRITCKKDPDMTELWDDRAVQVVPNTGRTLAEEHLAERTAQAGKAWKGGST